MKKMRKILALLLSAMLVLSMTMVAWADDPEEGSITINGVSTDTIYEIYKLLDLESYDTSVGAYSYKVNSEWSEFFDTEEALIYVNIDTDGYVTWKAATDEDTVAVFAKIALAYAKENDIDPVKSSQNPGEFTNTGTVGKFENLSLGYYLVDSTMGALCGLTTTNPDASINAKNGQPTIDKQVKEDSTNQWGESNTSDVGQTVEFRVTIDVHAGAENYILHDKMSAGLTFNEVTKIEHVIPGNQTHETPKEKYDVVTTGLEDECTFEIRFTQGFCDSLETNDKIIVYYNAMLNRNAIIALDGNPNETWLDYGEEHETTHDITKTYTYGFDLVKTDSQNTLIDGAEFKIYDAESGGNEVAVVLMDDGVTYRRARADETGISIVVKDGKIRVVGFDNGTYYLEETVAPDGYNKLSARQRFIISHGNLDAVFNDNIFSTGSGVHVTNKTGSMLPETGARGTMMFITFGVIVVLGTGVLLVTKKRMGMIRE